MGVFLNDIASIIEKIAPLSLAEPWDNCGWQIYCGNKEISKVFVTLSVTQEDLQQAIENNCELIISHHPITLNGIKNIIPNNLTGIILLNAIKSSISIYSAHTNLDKADRGINSILAQEFGLLNIKPLLPDSAIPTAGLGRLGELALPVKPDKFIDIVKKTLNIDSLKVINNTNITQISKVAICGGSGASLIPNIPANVDAYITGDIKYHDALEAINFILIDANHFNTENIILEELANSIKTLGLSVITSKAENPWVLC